MSSKRAVDEDVGSLTTPKQCSELKMGGYVLLKGQPCKIIDKTTHKTGKHGHAKCHVVGLQVFTGAKYEDFSGGSHTVQVPVVSKRDVTLVDIIEDDKQAFVAVLEQNGETHQDVKLPEAELGDQIRELFATGKTVVLTLLCAMNHEEVQSYKEAPG